MYVCTISIQNNIRIERQSNNPERGEEGGGGGRRGKESFIGLIK